MYCTLPKIFAGIAMLGCIAHTNVSAQESISKNFPEETFEILKSNVDSKTLSVCIDALRRFDNLDEYRFVHSNRTIVFQKIEIEVNLFSAKSLFVSSGRAILNACIDHGDIYSDIEFRLIIQDGIYSIVPIFINEKELICP
jgi:hypothetical protein